MSKLLFIVFSSVLLLLVGCQDHALTNNDKVTEIASNFKTVEASEICSIEVPKYFTERKDLNPEALIQYGFIDTTQTKDIIIKDNIFVTTSVFYKMDLEQIFGDSIKTTLQEFNSDFIQNLKLALTDAKAEFETPTIQEQNGIKSLHNEIYGSFNEHLVYYQIGLFETQIGFYQVLTWCYQDHLAKHKDEMFKMTTSFKEI